ncbi:MAG: excinuclease ABC subunit UvrB [Holosporales bacterium]|jgi:excinuclease ABC subunit B|nr:excinuclease ABC subunit UvrB [Holosporales bacterium]
MSLFTLKSPFKPSGDQPEAIDFLLSSLELNNKDQVLLGVTGSGKTYTIANVIARTSRPTLIISPNKTLASQLHTEMSEFFPDNAVGYFVSYYDYYKPEAYVPRTDTYIEKVASINDTIDRMRHAATRALLERRDVIIVASVSCIYGIGSAEDYSEMSFQISCGDNVNINDLFLRFTDMQYRRNDMLLQRGTFRNKGDVVEIFPAHYEDRAWQLSLWGEEVESIFEIDALTGEKILQLESIYIYPNSHYAIPKPTLQQAIVQIKEDLTIRLAELKDENKLLEAQRLEQRVRFDLESLASCGTCAGIENYSRYFNGRMPGEAPPTLFEYLPKDALLVIDESHVTVPQLGAMYIGDQQRKGVLSEFGFRLPSCKDNRPLNFEELNNMRPQTLYVSATPGPWELERTGGVFAEQIIRPTGLLDPLCEVHPCEHQVDDLIGECRTTIEQGWRVLVTVLTKKMAEQLSEYFAESGINAKYLHSEIKTLERIEIIRAFRAGEFDVLVGINLLREGLDIPECALVAILDADKEGFLRSKRSLIQTIGRAARNANGRVIFYADVMTDSLKAAIEETEYRRSKQAKFNEEHGITPQSIKKKIEPKKVDIINGDSGKSRSKGGRDSFDLSAFTNFDLGDLQKKIDQLEATMKKEALNLNFEKAAALRDEMKQLNALLMS